MTVRLSATEVTRIRRLASPIYETDSAQRSRGPLTDSDVLRLALAAGLDVLESQYRIEEAA